MFIFMFMFMFMFMCCVSRSFLKDVSRLCTFV